MNLSNPNIIILSGEEDIAKASMARKKETGQIASMDEVSYDKDMYQAPGDKFAGYATELTDEAGSENSTESSRAIRARSKAQRDAFDDAKGPETENVGEKLSKLVMLIV